MKYIDTKNTESVLKNMTDTQLLSIAQQIISYDGTFCNTELNCFSLYELKDLYHDDLQILISVLFSSKPDLSSNFFYFDASGNLCGTNDIDINFYLQEIAEWLVDHTRSAGFPDYNIIDDLADAIALDSGIDVKDL